MTDKRIPRKEKSPAGKRDKNEKKNIRNEKGTSLRLIALEILLEQEKRGSKLNILINDVLEKYGYLEREDRAFIRKLSDGTVERRITLDHVIDRFSRIKTSKQKSVIKNILRLSTYQLLYMDHVPAHTVCDEAVRLTKKKHIPTLSGYVNGVLRSMIREGADIDEIEEPYIRLSCPKWIYDRFSREFGEDKTIDILNYFLKESPVYIRTNITLTEPELLRKRLADRGIDVEETDLPYAFRISNLRSVNETDGFNEGLFSVQDLSSMYVGEEVSKILESERPESFHILDVCASPGGKSCHSAEILMRYGLGAAPEKRKADPGTGVNLSSFPKKRFRVEARDISERKLYLIEENRKRLGLDIIDTCVMDASDPEDINSDEDKADLIIADLPCSGLGVMGRKNDLKYRVRPEDITALQSLQRQILKASECLLKDKGWLIFSVCTILREETFEQRDWIRDELKLEELRDRLFIPGENGTDGFYYAVFKKQSRQTKNLQLTEKKENEG